MQRQQVLLARLRKARLRQLRPAHQRRAPLLRGLCRVRERAGQCSVKLLRTQFKLQDLATEMLCTTAVLQALTRSVLCMADRCMELF